MDGIENFYAFCRVLGMWAMGAQRWRRPRCTTSTASNSLPAPIRFSRRALWHQQRCASAASLPSCTVVVLDSCIGTDDNACAAVV